jgi:uncharacterized protein YxeA
MKRFLFLMSAMLILTLSSFGQKTMNSDDLINKYLSCREKPTSFQKNTLSYKQWKYSYNYTEQKDDLQNNNSQLQTKKIMSHGDYLMKAQKQRITGYVVEFVGVGAVCAFPDKVGIIGLCTCTVISLICELSSVNNLNKAGVSLSQKGKGVGLTVRF